MSGKLQKAKDFVMTRFEGVGPRDGRPPTLSRYAITCPKYSSEDPVNQGRPPGISRAMVNAAIRALVADGDLRALGPTTSDYTRIQLVNRTEWPTDSSVAPWPQDSTEASR